MSQCRTESCLIGEDSCTKLGMWRYQGKEAQHGQQSSGPAMLVPACLEVVLYNSSTLPSSSCPMGSSFPMAVQPT